MSSPGGAGGDGGEEGRRRIRDMQDLLRFCIAGSGEDVGAGPPLTPERRAWLEQALKDMSVDLVQEMIKSLANIHKGLQSLNNSTENNPTEDSQIEEIVASIDNLIDITEDLDLASDFDKIGGFPILLPLLESPHPELNRKGCELVGILVENHGHCQAAAGEAGLLTTLVTLLDSSNNLPVKTKALYAISCLIRSNPNGQERFKELDGFSVLLRCMQFEPAHATEESQVELCRLRTKCAFLLGVLMQEEDNLKEELAQMGFVEGFVGLLHLPHDSSHEHILGALLNLITDCPFALQECTSRPELQLPTLLTARLELVEGRPEFLEEAQHCNQILKLLKSSNSDQMYER